MTDDMRPVERRPIFLLGMLQRSGTNFLRDLLTAHPACGGTEILTDDFLLRTRRWQAWNHGRDARWLAEGFRGELARTLRRSIRRLNTEGL